MKFNADQTRGRCEGGTIAICLGMPHYLRASECKCWVLEASISLRFWTFSHCPHTVQYHLLAQAGQSLRELEVHSVTLLGQNLYWVLRLIYMTACNVSTYPSVSKMKTSLANRGTNPTK